MEITPNRLSVLLIIGLSMRHARTLKQTTCSKAWLIVIRPVTITSAGCIGEATRGFGNTLASRFLPMPFFALEVPTLTLSF